MKILVTAGATREPIDVVRYLSNLSTGVTGTAIAAELQARGHEVLLLIAEAARLSLAPRTQAPIVSAPKYGLDAARLSRDWAERRPGASDVFTSAEDLQARLRHHLAAGTFGAVIMAAAVSDYRPATAEVGKRSSSAETMTLQLVRTPKILPRIKSFSPSPLRVVGFKLTAGSGAAGQIATQFAAGGVDAVVHNDLSEITPSRHPFHLYLSPTAPPIDLIGPAILAATLNDTILK